MQDDTSASLTEGLDGGMNLMDVC